MLDGTELARWAEGNHPGWAVVWGAYNREFTAWALWSDDLLVVTAPDTHLPSIAVRNAEQRAIEVMPRTSVGTWRSGRCMVCRHVDPTAPGRAVTLLRHPPAEDDPLGQDVPGPWFVPARLDLVADVHN
jgi:hypothetical protein